MIHQPDTVNPKSRSWSRTKYIPLQFVSSLGTQSNHGAMEQEMETTVQLPKMRNILLGVTYNKAYSALGSILGSLC